MWSITAALVQAGQENFTSMLLQVAAVAGVIFVVAAGALFLFWKSLEKNPGGAAAKGSAAAGVNRIFGLRLGLLVGVLLLLSALIFLAGSP